MEAHINNHKRDYVMVYLTKAQELPEIPPNLVPLHVTEGYAAAFRNDPEIVAEVLRAYEAIKAKEFVKTAHLISETPSFTIVAGTRGVGRSGIVGPIKRTAVVCDDLECMHHISSYHHRWADACQMDYGIDGVVHARGQILPDGTKVEKGVYESAANWISDRLMTEALMSGRPVILETRAQTPHIGDLLDNITAAGAVINTAICQAPLRTKLRGVYNLAVTHGNIIFDEAEQTASHNMMAENMPVLAAKTTGDLKVYWRDDVDQPLQIVAKTTKDGYEFDPELATRFEGAFPDSKIQSLMGDRTGKPIDHLVIVSNRTLESAPAAVLA
jgi:hypothetical protein